MPVIKSSIKRMRQEEKRRKQNKTKKRMMKKAITHAKKTKSQTALSDAFSKIDKTAKKRVIHRNKAARLKSQLSKIVTIQKTKAKVSKS